MEICPVGSGVIIKVAPALRTMYLISLSLKQGGVKGDHTHNVHLCKINWIISHIQSILLTF